jgi:transcriptional regulator with XRE-family HTH domain
MTLDVGKVRRLRLRRKLTQDAAAKLAGVGDRTAWCHIEKGRRSISLRTLEKVAAALGVRAKDLLK